MSESKTAENATTLKSPDVKPSANHRTELEEFIREHNRALMSYVRSWVHSRADAADVVQEAYSRLFRLGERTKVRHVRGYLFQAARNIATDLNRQRTVREGFVHDAPLRGNLEEVSPEQIWLAREELETIQHEVEMLGPKCQFALLQVAVDGAKFEEVAAALGIKTHSARRLVERAIQTLRESGPQENSSSRKKRSYRRA
jgi:RNA polymerase sigma factor (sigma-70 family)